MVCIKAVMHIMNDRVTPGVRRRREHSPELKRDLVARSLQPGASVSALALEAGINANLLFSWRRAHLATARESGPPACSGPVLLPVTIQAAPEREATAQAPAASCCGLGTIEIDIGGARVRLRGVVDEVTVRCVLQSLRGNALSARRPTRACGSLPATPT